jgi:hypothetical protein
MVDFMILLLSCTVIRLAEVVMGVGKPKYWLWGRASCGVGILVCAGEACCRVVLCVHDLQHLGAVGPAAR